MLRANSPTAKIAQVFDGLKSDYNASKVGRFRRRRTGIAGSGSGGDYHYRNEGDFLKMMEYARDMDRNDSIVGQLVDRAVNNTVQNGMVPDPQTGDERANELLLAKFAEWANDPVQCDLAGMLTFADQQELVLRSRFVDGDIFALPNEDGPLELVEAHRCRTPSGTKRNVVHGVLLDNTRKRLEYWFTKDDIDPNYAVRLVSEIEAIPAHDAQGWPQVFHIYDPKRVSQTRGVTAFAPIFDCLGMFEDINFAKLVQQQIVSCIAFIRNRPAEAPPRSGDPESYGEQEVESLKSGAQRLIDEIAPGMEIFADEGETITGFSPQVPNSEYFTHAKQILTLIGVNLGMPLVLVTMDASDTNFSGWRGAVDQARMGFKRNQRWLIDHFLKPVYRWKVRQWTDPATGDPELVKLAAQLEAQNKDIYAHQWTTPKWPYIQPLQDAQADELRVKARQTSPRRLLQERGHDIDVIREELVEDNYWLIRDCIDAAQQLTEETGEEIHWRTLLHVANEVDLKPGIPSAPTTTAESVGQEVSDAA